MSTFKWDATKEQAAMLVALGELTNEEIAEKLDIGVATLYRWKDSHEFDGRVAANVAAIREQVLTQEISDVVKRIRRLNKRWQQIDQLIAARASDPQMQKVPGGDTGLLCHELKSIGGGESAEIVDVYKFDAALVKEERELAKQAAQECGQWTDRVTHEFGKLSDAALIERAKSALGGIIAPRAHD